jgi:hypothetical protein
MPHCSLPLILLCICGALPQRGLAQTAEEGLHPSAGVRIGSAIGSPIPIGDVPEGASGTPVVGIVVGAYVDWYTGHNWSVVSEVQFVHYASTFSTPLTDQPYIDQVPIQTPDGGTVILEVNTSFTGTATGQFSNDYLQLPVYAAWQAFDRWRFISGVYLGWLIATKSHATGSGQVGIRPETVEKDMYFSEKLNGLDYGIQLGAQYQAFTDLSLDLRGVLGLTSIFDEQFQTVDRTIQNTFVHLTLSYRVF